MLPFFSQVSWLGDFAAPGCASAASGGGGVSAASGTAPLDAAVIACALESYIPARFKITITI
jgi:hypothetical protein